MNQKEFQQLKKDLEAIFIRMENFEKRSIDEQWFDSADIKIQFNFSESKLYRLRKANKIPHEKIGGRYYYPKGYFFSILLEKIRNKGI